VERIVVRWTLCAGYDDAKDFHSCVYCHEWRERPFYWGNLDRSVFGGSRRKLDGRSYSPRYSYRHWIDGCLLHGAKLYVGVVSPAGSQEIQAVEGYLISNYPTKMNHGAAVSPQITIRHKGHVPYCLKGESHRTAPT
jgi:hypothetical protein